MKDSVSSQILQDIQTAWNTLNPQHIIKHLDKCFIYDSQWVFESLDYEWKSHATLTLLAKQDCPLWLQYD